MATATRKGRAAVTDAGTSGRLSRERRMRLVVSGDEGGVCHWNIVSSSGVRLAALGRRKAYDRGEHSSRRACQSGASAPFQVGAQRTLPVVDA